VIDVGATAAGAREAQRLADAAEEAGGADGAVDQTDGDLVGDAVPDVRADRERLELGARDQVDLEECVEQHPAFR
jgi:hypothetical protein